MEYHYGMLICASQRYIYSRITECFVRAQRIFLFFSFLFLFSSCQQELLESPSFEDRGSYPTGRIESPNNVTATQGGYREVSLTWRPSKLAKQYFIYSCDSSTGTFTKCAETPDETPSFSSKEAPGILKYYRVTAVDSLGNESEPSGLCFGTTLFTPVITKITKDTGGTAVTVHWYGGSNVYESTYLNVLCYEIVLFDIDGKTPLKEEIADGTQNSLTFSGLEANRQYYFQVKAYLKSQQDDGHTEKSDLVNESTARRLIPDAPAELTAKKGVSGTGVELSWKLPSSVDVKSGADYEPHPVYFKVLRKELSDDAYASVVAYIGVVKGNEAYSKDSLKESEYRINCQDETVSAKEGADTSLITVKKPDNAEEQTNAYYPEYISGTTITFKDTTAQVGKQYSYLVQSYSDDNGTRLVTSEESVATDSGWLITNPSLRTKLEYAENEDETLYTGVTVSFSAAFEDFGVPYKYVLYETCYKMNSDGTQNGEPETTEICIGDSVGGIAGYKKSYQINEDSFSYYSYMLKVYSADRTEEYRTANAPGSVLLVQDKNKQPVIEEFSVKDGFTGYFVLSWLYDERCAYTISWKNTDKNGHETDTNTLDLTESDITLSDEGEGKTRAVYRHPAENGDSRIYTLIASNGLKATEPLDTPFRTLKIPELQFTDIEYDKITVSWEADTMSDGNYIVTAQYDGDAEGRNLAVTDGETVTDISPSEDGKVSCVITKPSGYNHAELSGKAITLKVSTKSKTYSDGLSEEEKADKTASASVAVRTLGPAAANTRISEFDQKSIQVKWNEVPGANGYKIYRTKYIPDGAGGWKPEKVDVYYKDAGTFSVSEGDGIIQGSTTCSEIAGEYTLRDTYREPASDDERTNQYAESQSQISWGIPYSYTVIPVRAEDDFAGDIGAETGQFELKSEKVMYTDIAEFAGKVKGATYGYGLNVRAEKSKDSATQTITWEKPYSVVKGSKPRVYRRVAGTTGVFSLIESSANCAENWFSYEPEGSDLYEAYEYIVKYDSISDNPSLPESLEDTFKEAKDNESPTEQQNKGYLFAIQDYNLQNCGLSAKHGEGYAELVQWTENMRVWDYTRRALGPTGVRLYIWNNNLEADWHLAAEIASLDYSGTVTSPNDTDVLASIGNDGVRLSPKRIAEGGGTTDGLLKVLRDYKHYYALSLTRGAVETNKYTPGFDEWVTKPNTEEPLEPVYAYRQITDEELVRAATLAMAYGIQKTGTSWKTSLNTSTDSHSEAYPGKGSASVSRKGGTTVFVKLTHNFTFDNFAPAMPTKAGAKATFLTIGGTMTGTTGDGGSSGQSYAPRTYTDGSFTISAADTACGKLYDATMKISSLTVNGTSGIKITPNDGGETQFGNITPLPFGNGNWSFAANPLANGEVQWQ